MATRDDHGSTEDRLIARFFKPLATHPGALGLSDDAAFIKPPAGCDLVLKADAIIGGVHFFPEDPADRVAQKAMRVNLSDLAAKGARPLGFLVSLALQRDVGETWLAAFCDGLKADIAAFSCPLFGGDTDRTPGPITVSVAMFGAVPEGTMVRRAGAKSGDKIMVTGTIGDAALGLKARRAELPKLSAAQRDHLLARYLLPQPRNAAAEALRIYASAAMDISDGLAGDLAKLCRVSGVAGEISAVKVPLSDAAKGALAAAPALIETILTGGDDYEIVCTVARDKAEAFKAASDKAGVSLTEIGTIGVGEGLVICDTQGQKLEFAHGSFSHF
ncbi:MAG: thiamine-phosphate kinase [Pseudolabrys sp.]|nr:thiamine-phosphate kinase [Pseudolabrys sp.]